ncbi:angiogenic factor with G patch and FHA domains 1-like isoform X1 [Penaeus chinensis]|uniref:angiogenic factor with G patch and FHA domains 1-like isoform X1 n=1 Tax=Penaeus chinensis TaxID=139456 RepID=UPI001FB7A83E|nr:angiogenic factor with G patch and FHA domains 1-like isoform X1 [Penaeus chinensis]
MYSSTWEYVQPPTISPAMQTVNESALPSVEEAALELQADGKSVICNKCCSDVNKHKANDTGKEVGDENLKTHCECAQKTKEKERETAKHKRHKAKKKDKILDRNTKSDTLDEPKLKSTDSIKESYAVENNSQASLKDDKEYCKPDEPRLSDKKEAAHGWDNSSEMSILDQVKAAANEAVQGSGYVFQEELGLYYDYSTQYYYNAETGLYYDPRTGTYFYYDHASQAYQFHSQVAVDEKPGKKGKRKDDADREDSEGKRVKRIRKAKERNEEEREEGECTDSGEEELEQEEEEEEMRNEEAAEESVDREETVYVPPSLRLMVIESASERVKVGTLHLVTLDGGTVGREAKNLVQLPDLNISKVHAEISYHSEGPDDHHYYLKDLGSNNGTFVNDTRLSEPRETSKEVELGHGWTLQFGPVKVKCHIHPGLLTCNECEPGLVNANHSSQDPGSSIVSYKNAKTREKARKKELQAMKKKYALTSSTGAPVTSGDYNDRADRRRKEVGSDNPYEKTEVASTEVALRDNNKGFALLQKMGWSEGQSLGKSQKGIKQPIQPESVVGRAGFGLVVADVTPNVTEKKRKKVLQITKQRYNQT